MSNWYYGIIGYFIIALTILLGSIVSARSRDSLDLDDVSMFLIISFFWPSCMPVVLCIFFGKIFKEHCHLKSYSQVWAERKAKQVPKWDK